MKRLLTTCAIAVVALAAAAPAMAQAKEFGGSWVLDTEKSATKEGPPMVIFAFGEKDFTVKFGEKAPPMPFKLDGTESEVRSAKTKALWKNSKLMCTVSGGDPQAPDTITFSRDGAWLVLEGTNPQHVPLKLFFKKAPEKH